MARAGRSYPNKAHIGQGLLFRSAPEGGVCALGACGTALNIHNAVTVSRAITATVAMGTPSQNTVTVARGVTALIGRATETRSTSESGTSAAGLIGRATESRVATQTGMSTTGTLGAAVDRRTAIETALAALGAASLSLDRKNALPQHSIGCGALAGFGVDRKVAITLTRSLLGLSAANTVFTLGASSLGLSATVALSKHATTLATSTPGMSALGLVHKTTVDHGAALVAVTGGLQPGKRASLSGITSFWSSATARDTHVFAAFIYHPIGLDVFTSDMKAAVCGVLAPLMLTSFGGLTSRRPWPWTNTVTLTETLTGVVTLTD